MLRAMEAKLVANLEESRASFRHAGLRGGGVEASFREFLDSRLPRYLEVGTGEVIDTKDTRSGQTDVIIANEDQPIRSDRHDPTVFLIEGVAAAAEVKSRLTTSELDDSIAKGQSLRNSETDITLEIRYLVMRLIEVGFMNAHHTSLSLLNRQSRLRRLYQG